MKMNKEELKSLAGKLKIDFTNEEIDHISDSICEITSKLEEILKVDTEGLEPMFSNAYDEYNIEQEEADDQDLTVNMEKINNYDGTYVKLKRGENE